MFWGSFTANERGPYHFYATKTVAEKVAAQRILQDINIDYNVEAQLCIER